MKQKDVYEPPFSITPSALSIVADISEAVGRISAQTDSALDLRLRRVNRVRTIQGSLAIEGNTLSEDQITALLDGKHVIAPPREIQEACNAISAYDQLEGWDPASEKDLLKAHSVLMTGLIDNAGCYRQKNVGVVEGKAVIHMAPPSARVPHLMQGLFRWLQSTKHHPLVASSVFHYEFEFIHPFSDGNGRLGRLWQTLILSRWNPFFLGIPVESLVYTHQQEYYAALQQSTQQGQVTLFIEFMLARIRDAVFGLAQQVTPQVSQQVTPQVGQQVSQKVSQKVGQKVTRQVTTQVGQQVSQILLLLSGASQNGLSRQELQDACGLSDRNSFTRRWLRPALEAGFIEMTVKDKPNSRMQRYVLSSKGKRLLSR